MILSQIFRSISKKEWQFVVFLSLAVVFFTLVPVIYGFLVTPSNHVFTAMHFVSADDWFVYYSFINQAKEGSFLLSDLFAPVDHQPVLRPLWLTVGLVARFFNLSAPVAFHLVRIALIPIFFIVSYLFIAYLFKNNLKRKISLLFLAFSSGLGTFFIYRLAKYPLNYADGNFLWPMDLWVPDINTFLTLFTSPHFVAATILLLFIFLLTTLFSENYRYSYAVLAGLAGLVLFSFHPFQILKVFIIVGCFFLLIIFKQRKIIWPLVWYYIIFFLVSSPAILYYLWLLAIDWLTVQRALQNLNPTTPFYLTIIAFGGLLALAIIGLYFLAKDKKLVQNKYLFLATWLIIQFALLYAPISYQRRLDLGIHFPLVILTVIAIFYLYNLWSKSIKKHMTAIIVLGFLVFLPSTLFALAVDWMVFGQAREFSYLDNDTYQAFLWLKEDSPKESVIFSDVKTGNVLPAYALRTSYVGHAVETPYYKQKKIEPIWFFDKNREVGTEKSFLEKRYIDYIFYGEREREIGTYNPQNKFYLKKVYSSPTVQIYQVL